MGLTRAQPRTERERDLLKVDVNSPFALDYFDEGAAHIVYRLTAQRTLLRLKDKDFGTSDDITNEVGRPLVNIRFKNRLLRLRKDVPSAVAVAESHHFFKNKIEPLFPKEMLLEQELCDVSPEVLKKCNHDLRRNEKKQYLRNEGRGGTYLAETEAHGMLITSMLFDDNYKSCDFKPKWLSRSPSAPQGAKRCRTCALRAMKNQEPNFETEHSSFCPLVLTSGDGYMLKDHLHEACGKMRGAPLSMLDEIARIVPVILETPIMTRLKEFQEQYDPDGPLNANTSSENIRTAMTLRDCTVFFKRPYDKNGHVEARLGDFDLKSPEAGKAGYWRNIEQQLIDGEWYTATESPPREPKEICLLSPRR